MDFETSKSVNPFLMDDAADCAADTQGNGASNNPFLSSDFVAEPVRGDNPFLIENTTETYDLLETNPFLDFSTDFSDPSCQQTDSQSQQNNELEYSNSAENLKVCEQKQSQKDQTETETRPKELEFLSAPKNIPDNDFLLSSDDESFKPKRPPPPHPTMPKETQELILSVTGALEATSHHLLDRLPPTRAPSPTAFSDYQSLSPTPDTFIDLLGTSPANNVSSFTTTENLNEFKKPEKAQPPPRPPPVKLAPPKPAPPAHPPKPVQPLKTTSPVQSPKPQNEEPDMFDLFGTSKPPLPKTKDAILNLYAQPKPPPKDLLTDDLDMPGSIPSLIDGELHTVLPSAKTEFENKSNHTHQTEDASNYVEPKIEEPLENLAPALVAAVKVSKDERQNVADQNLSQNNESKFNEMENQLNSQQILNVTSNATTMESETHYIFGTKPSEPQNEFEFYDEPQKEPSSDAAVISLTEPEIFHESSMQQETKFSRLTNATRPPLEKTETSFDAFVAKFESTETGLGAINNFFDPFSDSTKTTSEAWGPEKNTDIEQQGFGTEDTFDAFMSMSQPPNSTQHTPSNKLQKADSGNSDEGGFSIFIKPREENVQSGPNGALPTLAPPSKLPADNATFIDATSRFNPFDRGTSSAFPAAEGFKRPPLATETEPYEGGFRRSESQETPPTPLFDDDVSQPLEDFPRIHYAGEGWEMQLRQPNKKKITGQRFWKKIFIKLVYQGDNPVLQLFNLKEDKDPFQELPLQACYSVSDISAQQYDQFGKIFTVKLQYIFYKERPGVRPGQVTKAERITNKLSQFAAYAIQGDYQGVKEFGSDLRKLGLPVEHAPQISQLLKLGCMSYESLKEFSVTLEECLFRMPVHRDRALNYKMEEVQITVVDEIYVEQNAFGHVEKQIARVRLFFLGFLSGMPDVELGLNDLWRQGKEVVGRHDIIPVVTEEWIRLEAVEFHSCIQQEEYEKTRTIKFKPPDACYIELMRFRIRPPRNRELPLQLKAVMCITGNKVELRADVLVPGFASRKLGQIPCEDVMIRFPIPECWIYLFRVEKHFRYGSVKSAHRRTGKIKGIERFLGAVDTLEPSLMEVTSGQAKYEHQHRSIVWRMPRLPKEGQGAYTTHNLVCRMQLTSFDQIPDNLAEYAYVEFTMPATQASHTTVRSVSLCNSSSDNPPEKYVRQLARHEYRVGIEHLHSEETAAYEAATMVKHKIPETVPETPRAPVESDSDSSD